jgi:hypothetical protein
MAWPVFSDGVAFHILIEQLIRIEFWTIPWQKPQTNLVTMLIDPVLYLFRTMDGMTINDEKYFPLVLAD